MSRDHERHIDDEWRRWIAENLILEGSRDSILATLKSAGFQEAEAAAEIDVAAYDLPFMHNDLHCFSPIDAGAVDFDRFPKFRNARVIDCEIGPGDLLFLPVGWWHYVKGLSISMTVTFTNFVFGNDFSSSYTTFQEL